MYNYDLYAHKYAHIIMYIQNIQHVNENHTTMYNTVCIIHITCGCKIYAENNLKQ